METSDNLLPTPNTSDQHNPNTKNNHDVKKGYLRDIQGHLSSQEASHASRSVSLDEEKERQTTATYGQKCLEPYNFTSQHGLSLKTCVASLLGATAWFSNARALTWKAKVTKSNRLLFQLAPSKRHIKESECGLLLTPSTIDRGERTEESMEHRIAYRKSIGRSTVPPGSLSEQIATGKMYNLLPTPDANDGSRGATKTYDPKAKSQSGRTVNAAVASGTGTGEKLRLQPAMTEWMMGFPENWTELPLAHQDIAKKD